MKKPTAKEIVEQIGTPLMQGKTEAEMEEEFKQIALSRGAPAVMVDGVLNHLRANSAQNNAPKKP
jgi:hypothetical protein